MNATVVYRLRIYCHDCRRNVVDARTEDGPLKAEAYCPGNPTHRCASATWEEKKADA